MSPQPLPAVRRLIRSGARGVVFFDGGRDPWGTSRSIVMCEPRSVLTERSGEVVELFDGSRRVDPVDWLVEHGAPEGPSSDVFNGGLAGFLGYEFSWILDDVRAPQPDSRLARMWVGEFETAAVFDHGNETWTVTGATATRAAERLRDAIANPDEQPFEARLSTPRLRVSRDAYLSGVQRCVDAIYAGELFEVNYTERFEAAVEGEPFELYEQLRSMSTGGWFGYMQADDFALASVSPEQFMDIDGAHVKTKPIKGTRRSSDDPERDAGLVRELRESEKDRAENVMIVDLMRNDLTRFCAPGSVEATKICEVESFAGIHHLVSTVEGELADEVTPIEAFLSAFPAGSITGAPKLRAIELAAEVEESARGPYTGSMFYAARGGRLDSNVLIRTACIADGVARYGAGGAIVADSQPEAEHDEAWTKARAFVEAGRGE